MKDKRLRMANYDVSCNYVTSGLGFRKFQEYDFCCTECIYYYIKSVCYLHTQNGATLKAIKQIDARKIISFPLQHV
jgi:hypothetical protein